MLMKNEKKTIEFSDEAILKIASKKPVCLIDLHNIFPDINKTRIAHRMKSLRTSKHLVKATTKKVDYYKIGDDSPV